jgi:hypothetical protein
VCTKKYTIMKISFEQLKEIVEQAKVTIFERQTTDFANKNAYQTHMSLVNAFNECNYAYCLDLIQFIKENNL